MPNPQDGIHHNIGGCWCGVNHNTEAEEKERAEEGRLREIEAAVRAWVDPEALELFARREAGDSFIGTLADPKWVRVLASLSVEARGAEKA